VGRKLLKLIKFLYAHKFRQVDLRKKPTTEWVLKQPSVERLDLGGWGRYAVPVYEVLLELRLIDESTEVRLPKVEPYKGRPALTEGEIENLLSLEREVNEYWERLEEIDRLMEEEKELLGLDEELYDLLMGGEGYGPTEGKGKQEFPDDDDDELFNLLFGED